MKIYIASDHAGRPIKQKTKKALKDLGHNVKDLSPTNTKTDDYPDFAKKVTKKVNENKNALGFLSCATGTGISIAANKQKGIRAAKVTNQEEAKLARKHNNANVLVLGNNTQLDNDALRTILKTFYETKFEKGRHLRRIKKIE